MRPGQLLFYHHVRQRPAAAHQDIAQVDLPLAYTAGVFHVDLAGEKP
jgi:hypothetical protein